MTQAISRLKFLLKKNAVSKNGSTLCPVCVHQCANPAVIYVQHSAVFSKKLAPFVVDVYLNKL